MKTILLALMGVMTMFLASTTAYSQEKGTMEWNGYIQTRLSSNFDESTEFTIRRAKLWVNGTLPQADYISYNVQLVYRSFSDDALMFQDAYANLRLGSYGTLRAGRFVPDFMLERSQPDYKIPVLERADVVNGLIHNSKQMAREIGAQYTFQSDASPLHFSLGVYNANVDKPEHSKDNSLLVTSRASVKVFNADKSWLTLGASAAYRHLDNIGLPTIYKADSLLSGEDFRWGFEALLHLNSLELQGEFVQANINSDIANGYYGLLTWSFARKYQSVVFTEKYDDLNPATSNNAWYGLGFNYQISGKTKLMADFKGRTVMGRSVNGGDIQLQVFFN
ncbi:MAG TPA: porin [Williamwhitmania sp.]|nr:porin [Williamwhitmania sp.]